MRNPWARETYEGPWNDLDKRWTPALRQQANAVDKNEGIFFLPVDIFREAFQYYYVGMYQNWQENRFFIGAKDQGQQFNKWVTSSVDQDVWITIDWMAARRYPANCQDVRHKHDYNIFVTDYSKGIRH